MPRRGESEQHMRAILRDVDIGFAAGPVPGRGICAVHAPIVPHSTA